MRDIIIDAMNKLKNYVVGYEDLIKLLFIAGLTRGHILIEGPTGTGKTTIAKLFAVSLGGSFKRVQMTPDLLPSDIIGSYYFDIQKREWVLRKGPIFTNVLFVDELNRAPPRTQSALIEAMQERQVTIEGNTFPLPNVFIVLASQMPVGTEGTYNLTPVLIDRFAYSYTTKLPEDEDQEIEIVLKSEVIEGLGNFKIINDINILEKAYEEISKIYVSDKILRYIARIVKFIRDREEAILSPSPRASIWMYRASKALAYLDNMDYVIPDHVKQVARYVLLHRIFLRPEYQMRGVRQIDLVELALRNVEVPK